MKIEAQEQYSLIDTIFNYIFDFEPPGKYLFQVEAHIQFGTTQSMNRKHVLHLATQTQHPSLQSGLVASKMKPNAFSIINRTMIQDMTVGEQK